MSDSTGLRPYVSRSERSYLLAIFRHQEEEIRRLQTTVGMYTDYIEQLKLNGPAKDKPQENNDLQVAIDESVSSHEVEESHKSLKNAPHSLVEAIDGDQSINAFVYQHILHLINLLALEGSLEDGDAIIEKVLIETEYDDEGEALDKDRRKQEQEHEARLTWPDRKVSCFCDADGDIDVRKVTPEGLLLETFTDVSAAATYIARVLK